MVALKHMAPWAAGVASTGARRLVARRNAIGYIGWTIGGNLGDEAMHEAARLLFRGRRVEVFSGARREAMLANLGLSGQARFDRVFLGGGTLINHGYLGVVQRALDLGLPVSTLGTGVGSSGFGSMEEGPPKAWRDALNAMDRVGVRGPRSVAKLQAIGVDKAEMLGDLALAMTPDRPVNLSEGDTFILNAARPSQPDRETKATEVTFDALSQAARALVSMGLKPQPVAFCAEDVAPTRDVLALAGIERAEIVRPSTAAAFLDLAAKARLAIGVRLHAAVLSACAGVPPLAIAYREKGHDFAESLGAPEIMVSPSSLEPGAFADRARELGVGADALGARLHASAINFRGKLEAYAA